MEEFKLLTLSLTYYNENLDQNHSFNNSNPTYNRKHSHVDLLHSESKCPINTFKSTILILRQKQKQRHEVVVLVIDVVLDSQHMLIIK